MKCFEDPKAPDSTNVSALAAEWIEMDVMFNIGDTALRLRPRGGVD